MLRAAERFVALCRKCGAVSIINDDVEAAVASGADGVLLIPADREVLSEAVETAADAVPVVTMETDMSQDGASGYISVDNDALGRMLGDIALNGAPDNRISRFLTGFMMVIGVLTCLGGLFSLIASPVAGIASLASGVCCVLMSLLLGEYRAKMTMLLYPPVQPMYSNMPPYTNVPPQQPGGPQGPNP